MATKQLGMGWMWLLMITQDIPPAFFITSPKLPFRACCKQEKENKSKFPLWGSQIPQQVLVSPETEGKGDVVPN